MMYQQKSINFKNEYTYIYTIIKSKFDKSHLDKKL